MCGISGIVDFNSSSGIKNIIEMTDAIEYRGPDDSGYIFEELDNAQVALGHRRLSIIDLSKNGSQPMSYEGLSIVYNGEVYNFKEIREELIGCGYRFQSDSDTEVVLKAYHKWGVEGVHRFNGMFAIAIYSRESESIVLIRDRAGVKPLYWYYNDGLFMFSSELKSFHRHNSFKKKIDPKGLSLFFQYGYIPQPYTIFDNTKKLEAGSFLNLDLKSGKTDIKRYWDVVDFYNKTKFKLSESEATEKVEEILKSACNYRMVSDVPVGIFLSGGYDSSAVAALLQSGRKDKIKTFSIGFHEEKFNEAHHAKEVADYLGTDHTEYYCSQKDALEILPELSNIWDEPFGDPSAIPTVLVSKLARKDVSVSLSADGGDEIFGGYDKYTSIKKKVKLFGMIPKPLKPIVKIILRATFFQKVAKMLGIYNSEFRFNRFSNMLDKNEKELLKLGSQVFSEEELGRILLTSNGHVTTEFDTQIDQSSLDNILAIDYKTYQLDDILTKVDRATMSVSLEGREPLLDHRLIEFVARLEPNLKINNGQKKYLLKKIVHNYLPKKIMDRPKMGFGVPIFDWFKDDLKEYLLYYLNEERLRSSEIFDVENVIELRDEYLSGNNFNIKQIWLLLIFEMWRERWM